MAVSDTDITGWTFRGHYDETRLGEIKSLYEGLGYAVLLAPFSLSQVEQACRRCFEASPERFTALYTRKSEAEGVAPSV
jgi:hypothetical protein